MKIDCLLLVVILRGEIPTVHYAVSLCCVSVTLEDDLKLIKSLPMNQMISVAAEPRLMTELVPEQLMLLGIHTVHVKLDQISPAEKTLHQLSTIYYSINTNNFTL